MSTHCVKRDGVTRFTGTANDCFAWLLKAQSQSIDWACKHEGWSIEPIPELRVLDGERHDSHANDWKGRPS